MFQDTFNQLLEYMIMHVKPETRSFQALVQVDHVDQALVHGLYFISSTLVGVGVLIPERFLQLNCKNSVVEAGLHALQIFLHTVDIYGDRDSSRETPQNMHVTCGFAAVYRHSS